MTKVGGSTKSVRLKVVEMFQSGPSRFFEPRSLKEK